MMAFRKYKIPGKHLGKYTSTNEYSDIVDHERSDGDVNKMLLGSFVEEYDEKENDDELEMSASPTQNISMDSFQTIGGPSRASTFQPLSSDQKPRDSILSSTPTRTQTGNKTEGTMASRPQRHNYIGLPHRHS